jgi:transglutaminase-like putative cysteine protease
MKYKITHKTAYSYSDPVPVCHNVVHLAARSLPYQVCEEFRLMIHPEPLELAHRTDAFGNPLSYFSIDQAHLGLTVTAFSRIEVDQHDPRDEQMFPSWEQVAADLAADRSSESLSAYQFFFDSPMVKPFPALAEYTRKSFLPGRSIFESLVDLTSRIHADFTFDSQATTIHTPVKEVFEKRHGVCQDFAHLQIACLRSIGLAARYVSGYLRTKPPPGKARLVGADASHAWVSLYCGALGWVDADPTNDALVGTDHVTLAWGRDYSDVCPIQGIIVGGGEHKMSVSVDVEPL